MAASRNLAEYYHWEETARGIRIYMHSAMADRLQAEILRASRGRHGSRRDPARAHRKKIGEGRFRSSTTSYRCRCSPPRPLYALSEEDTSNLEAALLRTALAGCESPDAPSILGYYRSHMRDGLWLSPDDLLVIDSYFQAPASVFLLVKSPGRNKSLHGWFLLLGGWPHRVRIQFPGSGPGARAGVAR